MQILSTEVPCNGINFFVRYTYYPVVPADGTNPREEPYVDLHGIYLAGCRSADLTIVLDNDCVEEIEQYIVEGHQ